MRLTSLIFGGVVLGLATGSPAGIVAREPQGHPWIPRLPGQGRSPCPGLNALANHGFLPRSGRDISLADIQNGISQGYNFDPHAFDPVFQEVVDFKLSTTGNASTFNLIDLAKHDTIEIDGSLSRNDFYFGNDNDFDPFIWAMTAKNLGLYDIQLTKKDQYVTVEVAAKARAARVAAAKKVNPEFNASVAEMKGSPGTTGLYLLTLWDEKADAAPKSWIRSFFEQERIPYLEGYAPFQGPAKTTADLQALVGRILAVMTKRDEAGVAIPAHRH